MMELEAVIGLFPGLEAVELSAWIERRWVQPETTAGERWVFHAVDVARVSLIYDLRRELDIAKDMVPLVLSLLDQVYELRITLKATTRAIEAQPPEVQEAILAALKKASGED